MMGKGAIPTHAGDDSDGKLWGIEGTNILFLLAGLLLSIGLVLLLTRHHAPSFSVGVGAMPLVFIAAYVLTLRQGKPKSYDTDLLETLAIGNGWTPPEKQRRNPLF